MTYIDMDWIDHIDSKTVFNAHIDTVCVRESDECHKVVILGNKSLWYWVELLFEQTGS